MVHRKNNIWLIEKEIFIIIIDSFVLFFFGGGIDSFIDEEECSII